MRAWKCYNPRCAIIGKPPGFDFIAVEGKCPKCGIVEKDGTFGRFIVPCVWIHFEPPSGIVDGIGSRKLACTGGPIQGQRVTGAPGAVNCPRCKESEAFRSQLVADSVHPDFDLPVAIDVSKNTFSLVRSEGVTDGN